MPKIIVIKTDGIIEVVESGAASTEQFSKSLNSAVEGWIEIVRPITGVLEKNHVMIVNEEGHCKSLPINPIGTRIYGYSLIAGNVSICKEIITADGIDLAPFDDEEIIPVASRLKLKLATNF